MSITNTSYADLEISLRRILTGSYEVELRFSDPDPQTRAQADEGAKPRGIGKVAFDFDQLRDLQIDPKAYGEALTQQIFHKETVREHYKVIRSRVELLRIRLWVHPSALELNTLRWELLMDPDSRTPLATSEKTLFSRFVEPRYDWIPVKLRRKSDLKALVVVAAPTNLTIYKLPDIDPGLEIERAYNAILEARRTSDIEIEVKTLGDVQPATVEGIFNHLREGIDILYIVCHGELSRRKDVPILYLQDENGEVETVTGDSIVERLGELQQLPRLVVLASCESAKPAKEVTLAADEASDGAPAEGASTEEFPTALGSLALQLVWEGVPAVIAMQGKISINTIEDTLPVFFKELLRDGQIDRALAVARGKVRDHHDFWMPALFLRLRQGRIWYEPGFAGEESQFKRWDSICCSVGQGKFIPILGAGVSEQTCGTNRELARHLAEAQHFPLAPHDRLDLAKVIEYLSISQSRHFAETEVLKRLYRQVLKRNHDLNVDSSNRLSMLLRVVAEKRREENGPLQIIAELPASIFVNACADTLLLNALKANHKKPEQLVCKWRRTGKDDPKEPSYKGVATQERPIVYQVFGVFGQPESLVLTEDDFFNYLIATATYKLLPNVVRGSCTQGSLLFLGFQLTNWTFRILFRLIMNLEGVRLLRNFSHVAVQLDPEEHSLLDVERARNYVEEYFSSDRSDGHGRSEPRIDIYWGTVADFLTELRRQLDERANADEPVGGTEEYDGEW